MFATWIVVLGVFTAFAFAALSPRAAPFRNALEAQFARLAWIFVRDPLIRRTLRRSLSAGYRIGDDELFEFLAASRDLFLEDLQELFSSDPDLFEIAGLIRYARSGEVARYELPLRGRSGAFLRALIDPDSRFLDIRGAELLPESLRGAEPRGALDHARHTHDEMVELFGARPDIPTLAAITLYLEDIAPSGIRPVFSLRGVSVDADSLLAGLVSRSPATGLPFVSDAQT